MNNTKIGENVNISKCIYKPNDWNECEEIREMENNDK